MNQNRLLNLLVERLGSGLQKRSLTKPSRWAQAVRIMGRPFPGKWSFKYHPWLEDMHDSTSELNVGQKAAQLGYTETMLNIVFFKIDVESVDCLYVLPAKTPDAKDFSAARFDPALELSPYLSGLFSDVKNIGHKRAGNTNLYIRGSRSRAGLKSIPTGLIILDEVDEFNQKNISLALERTSGQKTRQVWMISTPTIDNYGINQYFVQSTQDNYFFKCPSCSRFIDLTFPESLEITSDSLDNSEINNSYLKCKECKNKLVHEEKPIWLANYNNSLNYRNNGKIAQWVPQYPTRDIRGFHISQLYSSTISPIDLAKAYLRALYNPADEQTFYNDKLGIPHIVEGAKLTKYQIDNCKGNYLNGELKTYPYLITMGIDVGKIIYYEVTGWSIPEFSITDINIQAKAKILEVGRLIHFEEIDNVMKKYRVMAAVIDANPERRKAYEFTSRFYGHVKMCFYGQGIHSKQINKPKDQLKNEILEPTITVDRTSWLDLSLGRFRNQTITIPSNIPEEYINHLTALTRIYERDKDGNNFGRYVKGSSEDHYAHARNYSEIALVFAAHISNPQSMKSPI